MSSSMDSEVGKAVGGAALGGLALGFAMQSQRADTRWEEYVRRLEAQVRDLEGQLDRARFAAVTCYRQLGESDEEIHKLRTQVTNANAALVQAKQQLGVTSEALSEKSATLSTTQAELAATREANELNSKKARSLSNLVEFMRDKCSTLERNLTRQSANTFVLTKVLNRLTEEIQQVSNPEKFESLDPDYLLGVLTKEWEQFEETGRMSYTPALVSLSEAQQKVAFGGADEAAEATELTTSSPTGSSARP